MLAYLQSTSYFDNSLLDYAVALASSAVLGDAFAYLAIQFDRPFELGDFFIVGDYLGSVEHIGMKTTRLRSLGGEQLVFSNKDLTDSRLRNYKRMRERRVVFSVGVTYGTTLAQNKEAPQLIKSIVESLPSTRFDRSHFSAFADFSLTIETVYYVLSPPTTTPTWISSRPSISGLKKPLSNATAPSRFQRRCFTSLTKAPTAALRSRYRGRS